MQHRFCFAALAGAVLLSGCYWEPQRTEILVSTAPPGASCVVTQFGYPLATVEPTPAIALVGLAPGELTVQCRRPGFLDAAVTLPPPNTSQIPGFVSNRRPGVDYEEHVDIALAPLPPGAPH